MKRFVSISLCLALLIFKAHGTSIQFVDSNTGTNVPTWFAGNIAIVAYTGGTSIPYGTAVNHFSIWSGYGPHWYNSNPTANFEVPGGYGGWTIWVVNSSTGQQWMLGVPDGQTLIGNGSTPNETLTYSSATNAQPVYTNFVFSMTDNLTGIAIARFYWNGALAYQAFCNQGQTVTWTSPSIEVSPTQQLWTETQTLGYDQLGLNPATNSDGSTTFQFAPPSVAYTGGTSGSGSSNAPSPTPVTVNNTPTSSPTNIVTFPTPTGSASESTMAAGFQLLHNDNLNSLTALGVIDQDIGSMRWAVTNTLTGVISILERSNSDDIGRVIAAFTNLPASSGASSNAWVMNWPTNSPTENTQVGISNLLSRSLTNNLSLQLSNYATESTLAGISNLLGSSNGMTFVMASNLMMSSIPSSATNGDAATAAATSALAGPLGVIGDVITSMTTPPDVGSDPGHTTIWEMNFCGTVVDLDPIDRFPIVAAFSMGLWEFVLVAAYLFFVGKQWVECVRFLAIMQTGGVPDMEVEGGGEALTFGAWFGGNFIGVFVAVIVPAVLLALWVAAVSVLVVPLGDMIGLYEGISTVFGTVTATPAGAAGMHVLFATFPVALAIKLLTARIVLYFTMSKVMVLCVGASRYLFGR